ncbi:hypothetical protein LOZ58_002484 [Ophidiomyces ophidiicola]|nr:hypothetical protein LOZ65_000028 [Ophidiomyces ophidiicola]KAI1934311.1 hypothetical protein LOZ66_006021 [Ophidiomyces ophidiicola]KAI1962860.1 hypothetical protein LOZ58_002484 [Ophidiomyces ophidiicola]
MTPAFGMSRPQQDMTGSQAYRRPPPQTMPNPPAVDPIICLSFNVPLSSNIPGPDPDDVLHSTPGALVRWTYPDGILAGTPVHKLPIHSHHVDSLRKLCRQITESYSGRLEATVTSTEPKAVSSLQRRPQGLVTNVCISGEHDLVHKIRARILRETPFSFQCAIVDIDVNMVMDPTTNLVRQTVLTHLNTLASYTGVDIFLLSPKIVDADNVSSSYGYSTENGLDRRFRIAIYGDEESAEHAKTRVLIMIDQILKRQVDVIKLELTLHTLICGRGKRNIKHIEAVTNTAIYFPPSFPRLYGYTPPGSYRRCEDEVYITGATQEDIARAKQKLLDLVRGVKVYIKDATVTPEKIDSILLDRLDKIRKVMEANGCYILFPPLAGRRNKLRVQGTEILHVERTIRELMTLASQFYEASWWIIVPEDGPQTRLPSLSETRVMLSDICANSGAEVSFEKLTFTISGSDDSVKSAMTVIHQIPFVKRSPFQMRVKIELANEHKEFVSGKKNGKINKIMSQSNVQIIFDGFNEYNFHIDVCGTQYGSTRHGLELVEQEMPASISFHVPDQYHKRIIGIGGQHIQRIMKKYSVFVKFSNAMDRGGVSKDDDDIRVENVICRTPARNAQSLEYVKQEIMDMVEKVDAEFVSENVLVNRLYHRELISRMNELDELEKKWNCKIDFPSTETASDFVTISGPEYQVAQAVDAFLGMVPETHEISFHSSEQLQEYFKTPEFANEVRQMLKDRYEVDIFVEDMDEPPLEDQSPPLENTLILGYTQNNAGGLKDAIDFLVSRLVSHGLDATTVKGSIPRPKSDSFEDSLPFFNARVLQNAPTLLPTDSPTRINFTDDAGDRGSIFERLRKPGSISSFSSFIGRKNHSGSPGSFFKHASSNASKASLVSMESRDSGYRNPWNDSGVNLPGEDVFSSNNGWPSRFDSAFPIGVAPGDMTPRHDSRASLDSARPSTSNSASGYPAPIGPPR